MLHAAWPITTCDANGFTFEPTFKVQKPLQEAPICEESPSEIQDIVTAAQVCATCWGCTCGAAQNLTWKCARQQTTIKDLETGKEEALSLCGFQQQLTSEHWDRSAAELVKRCAAEKKTMNSMQQQLEKQESIIMKLELEVMTSSSRRNEMLEERLALLLDEKHKLQDVVDGLQAKEMPLKIALGKMSALIAVGLS